MFYNKNYDIIKVPRMIVSLFYKTDYDNIRESNWYDVLKTDII